MIKSKSVRYKLIIHNFFCFIPQKKQKPIFVQSYPIIDFSGICVKFEIKRKKCDLKKSKKYILLINFCRNVADAIDPMERWFSLLEQNAVEAGLFGAFTGAIIK